MAGLLTVANNLLSNSAGPLMAAKNYRSNLLSLFLILKPQVYLKVLLQRYLRTPLHSLKSVIIIASTTWK